jgi:aminotransferase EvaB
MIKFWDYSLEYKILRKKIIGNIDNVLKSGDLIFGKQIKLFEKNFIKKNKSKFGIALNSGTDAIYIALKSLNIGINDEVITVSNTAIPTIAAIKNTGAKVLFVDVNDDYLINTNKIEEKITKNTKAIVVVHLYGQPCDIKNLLKLSKKYKIDIVEDCAQSFGAKFQNKIVGNFGAFGCFSFYPTKILGTYGDGGFLTTNNKLLYEKAKRIRFYGIETSNPKKKFYNEYYSNENGTNSRLSEIQSSILNIKIKNINKDIKRRREIAKIYFSNLKNTELILPRNKRECFDVYHLFVVRHKKRDEIIKNIQKKVEIKIHYKYPNHKMKAYCNYVCGKCNCLSNTELFSQQIFSLPLYPELTNKKIFIIIKILKKILNKSI